jgi:aspartate/tyrosine/aromatic aminotransferase
MASSDPNVYLQEAYALDPNPCKINLCVGVYQDAAGILTPAHGSAILTTPLNDLQLRDRHDMNRSDRGNMDGIIPDNIDALRQAFADVLHSP